MQTKNASECKEFQDDEHWKTKLSKDEYQILRKEATERPFSSEFNEEKSSGVFHCRACNSALFESNTKYDSGTGWPSFYACIEGSVETKVDNAMLIERIEYHCANCGGHQGHLFQDGPKPTGLRYCNNGLALKFKKK